MDVSKLTGQGGSFFLDNSCTNENVYAIVVISDAVFTVLEEIRKTDNAVDVMTEQNLTSKTVTAGAVLTPNRDVFSAITITSGKLVCYRLGI